MIMPKIPSAGDSVKCTIDPGTRIGHVHLKVADLDRALHYYCDVLGFSLAQRFDAQTALISAGRYHHLIGLNTRESLGGAPPPEGCTGLYHVAILLPTRAALASVLRRLMAARMPVDKLIDHGVSEAVYVSDPDGNALELCWDRPEEKWPRKSDGTLDAFARPLNPQELLSEGAQLL
jgi:catechol 2,3-dioxygenase